MLEEAFNNLTLSNSLIFFLRLVASCYFVLPKSIPTQIRQLCILFIVKDKLTDLRES